jgi:hypothetical protein
MEFEDGTEARVGDRVHIANSDTGTVVASIDAQEYSPGNTEQDWAYLGNGIIVRTDAGAFVRFADPVASGLLRRA